ncbi:MAG: NGG1p interacting factor NIF3 [Candidatus Omnitrophota bacterium]
MKLADIYKFSVKRGIDKDPRTRKEINEALKAARKEFLKSKGADRRAFDRERLWNPYADTRILYGAPEEDIKTVMVGIDMEVGEILAADRLSERGEDIDLVMAHHPEGAAWAAFYDVMHIQEAVFNKLGIPMDIGKSMLKDRIAEVQRAVSPANHSRSVDVARLLGIPYMCVHTPADNHVTDHLQRMFDTKRPAKLSHVLAMLKGIPEYFDGLKKNAGPRILVGDPDKKAGKVFVDMTGGTEGPKRIFGRLSQAGVGTIVAMHLSEEHFKNAKEEHINIVIAGHIASDTLGLNLLLDSLEKKAGLLKIIPCSGFIRVKR